MAGLLAAASLTYGLASASGMAHPSASLAGASGPREYSCPIFPPGNPLNRDISRAPVDANSARYIEAIGAGGHLHADFGTNPSNGIPYAVVGAHQPKVPISFSEYGAESDPGPYPIPPAAPVEGAGEEGDRHVLVLQKGSCRLYELYAARRLAGAGKRGREPSLTCAATPFAPKAGHRPMPPACRSSLCWSATPRCAPERSTMRCA